ncbi:MAG: hypothetical protein ABTS16_20985 [Candidatus Accumulibacter phosphatis]|jgi:hypothetical protein|nr:hypothetical protein [Candidatus Accumulibacter contiguus]
MPVAGVLKEYRAATSDQIKAVAQMINILAGGQRLLDVPAE